MNEPRQHHNITLIVLAASACCYALSQTMIAPALPEIQHELGASTTGISWALTAFLLSASIATPILGRLGDMFGKDRILLLTLALFAVGSLIGALSHSLGMLLVARVVQGTSSGVFPLAYGITRDEFPPEKAASGIGLISGMFGIGGGLGLVLSGFIVDNLSYEWIFWIALIVAGLTLLASWRWVPASPIRSPARIDWLGAAVLAAGLAALLIAISEVETWGWTDDRTLGLFAGSLVILAIWTVYENRRSDPLVDIPLLRERGVPSTNLTTALVGFGMFAAFILIPQFVQTPEGTGTGFSASVTQAGLYMLPQTTAMLLAGPVAGALATRRGAKLPMTLGALLMAASFIYLAFMHDHPWQMIAGSAVMGLGVGAAFASMANLIVELVPQSQTGEATGMNTIMRTVGGALGAQIAASILANHLASSGLSTTDTGFTVAFAVTGFVCLAGAFVSLAIPSERPSPEALAADREIGVAAGAP